MKIAILALQGAFAEHEQMFRQLGTDTTFIRNLTDWADFMSRSLEGMRGVLPVLGTCAGLIMLDRNHLNVMDITARRNAYGRQLGSFNTKADFKGIGRVPMTFIRAPYIEEAGPEVEILARVDGKAVAARQGNMLVTAFHPELTADTRIHELFLKMVASRH